MKIKKDYILWAIIVLGVILRLAEYVPNRSLSTDEAVTANKLISVPLYSMVQLKGSDYRTMHGYPIGFLAVEKGMIALFGSSEYILRLFPLICGCLSLLLFYQLSRKVLTPAWSLLSLFIFATNRNLIYFSSELKPYAPDIFIALLLWLMLTRFIDGFHERKYVWWYALVGFVAVFFSFTSFFLLASVTLVLLFRLLKEKNMFLAVNLSLISIFWFVGMVVYYFLSLRYFSGDKQLFAFWSPNFMPVAQGLDNVLPWIIVSFSRTLSKSLLMPAALAGILMINGVIVSFIMKNKSAVLFLPPIVLMLILSAFKIYPFEERTVLFLVPGIIIFIVQGIYALSQNQILSNKTIIPVTLSVGLLFFPLIRTAKQFTEPLGSEEIKTSLKFLKDNYRQGDVLGVYAATIPAYEYYFKKFGLPNEVNVFDHSFRLEKFKDSTVFNYKMKNRPRVWLVFTHVRHLKQFNERKAILKTLNRHGRMIYSYEFKISNHSTPSVPENRISSAVYLYDLSEK